MPYTIQQVARMTGIPASTLRYYDSEGLLPFLERNAAGYRVFSDVDIAMLQILQCLKMTRMAVSEIKQFTEWVRQGDATLKQRHAMFLGRRKAVEQQMEDLRKALIVIEHKCEYYRKAVEAGTERHLRGKDTLPCAEDFAKPLERLASTPGLARPQAKEKRPCEEKP